MNKCPFCGRKEKPTSSLASDHCKYVGDLADRLRKVRSPYCYEEEIYNLKEIVLAAAEHFYHHPGTNYETEAKLIDLLVKNNYLK